MPSARNRQGHNLHPSPLGALAAVILVGLAVGLAALLFAALAVQSSAGLLGPPSANLPWYEVVPLELYLTAREPDLLAAPSPNEAFHFQVSEGDTVAQVADRLQAQGRLSDPTLFRLYLRYTGGDLHLAPGLYAFPTGTSTRALADALAHGTGRLRLLVVLPGLRAEEIPPALASAGLPILPRDFLEALQRRPGNLPLYADLPPQASLEGFLFPGHYLVDPSSDADLVVYQMVSAFNEQMDGSLRSGFTREGLTLYQAVVLASIVQREVVVAAEMPVVASVFLNRLARGMPLQADATVQYAVGYVAAENAWWKDPLSAEDLKSQSPFNTYLHNGLPPSPIDSPGLEALKSVADPAQTWYLYFRAACDGSGRHVFSQTYEEHLSAACP